MYVRHDFVNNREFFDGEYAQAFAEYSSAHTFKVTQKISVYNFGEIFVFRIESVGVVCVTLGGCCLLEFIFFLGSESKE